MRSMRVLLLNQSEEPLRLISWQRAVCMLEAGNAQAPYNYDDYYTIKTSHGDDYMLPSALVMTRYVRVPYRRVRPTRENIFLRDAYVCQYTGERLEPSDASVDHIIPTSRGGKHHWGNVVTCKKLLNHRKGDRTPDEFGIKLVRKPDEPNWDTVILNAGTEVQQKAWSRWRFSN